MRFFAVFAAFLNALADGAPFAPGFLIRSFDPAAIRAFFFKIFLYKLMVILVKRPSMYLVHCREQYPAGQLLRFFVGLASFRAVQHMSEASWRSSRPLAFFAEHPVPVFREYLQGTLEVL